MPSQGKRKRTEEVGDQDGTPVLSASLSRLHRQETDKAGAERRKRFAGLRCVRREHYQLWYEGFVAFPMPESAPRDAVALVLDLLPIEQQNRTEGMRLFPAVETKTRSSRRSSTNGPRRLSKQELYDRWASQCSRVSGSMMRILPLWCFYLAPSSLYARTCPKLRRQEISRWCGALGEVYPAVDMLDDLVQCTVTAELEQCTGLLGRVCRIITPYVVCTCAADAQPWSCRRCRCNGSTPVW